MFKHTVLVYFDHFVGLALKGLKEEYRGVFRSLSNIHEGTFLSLTIFEKSFIMIIGRVVTTPLKCK